MLICDINWLGWQFARGRLTVLRLCRGDASLAQSVERFHGKEEVNSSILLGGSPIIPSGGRSRPRRPGRTPPGVMRPCRVELHGDVAQLVRVLDS